MTANRARVVTVAALTLIGAPWYVACAFGHMCMCGHLAHAFSPRQEGISDLGWIICFPAVLVFAVKMQATHKWYLLGGSSLLIASRFAVGDPIPLDLIVLAAIIFVALGYLFRPSAFDSQVAATAVADAEYSAPSDYADEP